MKKIILGGIVVLSSLSTINAQSGFPYNNPLTSTKNITTDGAGAVYQAQEGGIQLTKNEYSAAYMILNGLTFSTKKGFNIDFTYTMHEDPNKPGALAGGVLKPGIGFSFILYDPLASSTTMGSFGGGLGYVYNATYQTGVKVGFSGGYLGIGFDMVGINKAQMIEKFGHTFGYQFRAGIPNLTNDMIYNGSNITIRGPINNDYTIPKAPGGLSIKGGYPVLISQSTNNKTADVPSRYLLNTTTGSYTSSNDGVSGSNFNIMTNEYTADPTNPNYRRVLLSLLPGKDASNNEGFYVNVSVYHGTLFTFVLKDFFVNSSPNSKITYPDLARAQQSPDDTDIRTTLKTMSLAPPEKLGIAIAASAAEGYGIITAFSNVNITLPNAPVLPDVGLSNVCSVAKRSTTFSVLDNAIGYNNNVYSPANPPVGKRDYIDQTSFKFRTLLSDGSYEDTANPYICTTKAGTYTYNPSTGTIIFVASAGAAALKQDIVYYNIRNKAPSDTSLAYLSTDEYRSRTAKATLLLNSTDCPPMPIKFVKINK